MSTILYVTGGLRPVSVHGTEWYSTNKITSKKKLALPWQQLLPNVAQYLISSSFSFYTHILKTWEDSLTIFDSSATINSINKANIYCPESSGDLYKKAFMG